MACFPKIDQPCPLGIDEQKRIDGYCGHCSKAVHSLTAMSDADRLNLLRNANGPICVSYRVKVRRGVSAGFSAALALSVINPAHAVDTLDVNAPNKVEAVQMIPPPPPTEPHEMMLTGGVSDPQAAQFVDESDVPDLPMVRDGLADERPAHNQPAHEQPVPKQ